MSAKTHLNKLALTVTKIVNNLHTAMKKTKKTYINRDEQEKHKTHAEATERSLLQYHDLYSNSRNYKVRTMLCSSAMRRMFRMA